jgi:peptide deformylase
VDESRHSKVEYGRRQTGAEGIGSTPQSRDGTARERKKHFVAQVISVYFQRTYRLLTYGPEMNNILAKPVEESEWPDIPKLFEYMLDVMRKAEWIGLAAPQIGCFKQFALIERHDGSIIGLVNPEITRLYGKEIEGVEGCLSLPPRDNTCMVPRLEIVDVETSLADRPDVRRKMTFRGKVARIVQHELDHLTGTFFIDRVPERRKEQALERFHNWKAMRRAQIRRNEERENVSTGTFAISRGQSRVS